MTSDADNGLDMKDALQLLHCVRCDKPLVAQPEIEQAVDLLNQAGLGEMVAQERRDLLQTCTECKTYQRIHSFRNISIKAF